MGLERVFDASWTLRDLRKAPLGSFLDDYCDWLLDRGFSWHTVRTHVGRMLHLNRWLAECGWSAANKLNRNEVEGFLAVYPERCRCRGVWEDHLKRMRHSLSRFVEFLCHRDLFDPLTETPIYQPLLDEYLLWMRDHQHAAEGTVKVRESSVARFLISLGEDATTDGLAGLDAHRVESFFIEYSNDRAHASRRSMQSALRTLLRFCFYQGYIQQRLDRAVPTLRTYKLARVPRGVTEAQAQAVLASVDRTSDVGRRDYAILTLLHTYGVRGGQVRALRLDDIHWSQDRILFRATKGGKDSLLPLAGDVGESLLAYLRNGRPHSTFREVFLTCRAPYHPFRESSSLSEIIGRHIRGLGLEVPSKGSHAFRHGFATRMVADGHPLKAIADILGHRYLSTTFIYTKVDFNALSQVALEWPEGERS
ncbi:MAG: integrase/recombinase XerD [Candidatus Promineifilaceae bacterium]|jgi:integrase/recombinase XerD